MNSGAICHLKEAEYLSMPLDLPAQSPSQDCCSFRVCLRVGPVQEAEIIANHFERQNTGWKRHSIY